MPKQQNKRKWKVGQKVYIVSGVATKKHTGRSLPKDSMGKLKTITDGLSSDWSDQHFVYLDEVKSRIHQDDVSKTNTYVDPFKSLPDYLRNAPSRIDHNNYSYYCDFILYKHTNEPWNKLPYKKRYQFLTSSINAQKFSEDQQKKETVIGGINPNQACFASLMPEWSRIEERTGQHPTRMLLKIKTSDIRTPSEEVTKFYSYMKKGACLPQYLKLPTAKEIDDEDDIYLNIRLEKISKERLYWYCCVLRNPAEQPGITGLVNYFIEEGKMEPLMGYVMGHVCQGNWHGGHAAIGSVYDLRDDKIGDDSNPMPNMNKVIDRVVKYHKFLTKSTLPNITDISEVRIGNSWNLDSESVSTKIRFKSEEASYSNAPNFRVKTRTYE